MGAGGPPLPPATLRAIDLSMEAAAELPGFPGLANVMVNIGNLGPGGAATWTDLKAPGVTGTGGVHEEVTAALGKIVDAANVYGRKQAAAASPTGGMGTLPAGASQQQIMNAMIAAAQHIAGRPYIYGGGHGSWESPATTAPEPSPTSCTPPDCSAVRWTPLRSRIGGSRAAGSM